MGLSDLPRTLAATAAAIGVMFAGLPTSASASPRSAPDRRVRDGVSSNWSGYAVAGAGPYTSVSASWTQPAVECATTPNSYSSFWVGLDGSTSKTVEQTGTEGRCLGGVAVYGAWYEMFPKRPSNLPDVVAPGDSLSASVTSLGRGRFKLTLSDSTQGWSNTTVQKRKSAKLASAEVIAEAPSTRTSVLPLADFGTLAFGSATVDRSPLSGSTPGIEPITMTSGAIVRATPSPILGGEFSVTWSHE